MRYFFSVNFCSCSKNTPNYENRYVTVVIFLECNSATPSNCGDVLKLLLPSSGGNTHYGQGNDLGYGKNVRDDTMGNPQPSPKPQ